MTKLAAFALRDLREWGSYRFAVFLQVAGLLFTLMVFYFISQAVDVRDASSIGEYADRYFDFVVVGIAVIGYVNAGLGGMARQVRDAQMSGTLEALLVTPTSVLTLLVGSTLTEYAGATLRLLGLLALADLVFEVPLHWERAPAAALVLALVVVAFSGVGMFSAAFVMVFKRGDPLAQAIAWGSMLLGGVYFPARAVGDPSLEAAAAWLPLTPALRALRLLLLRGESFAAVAPQVGSLALMAGLLLPAGLASFAFGVRRARVAGTLTHY